MLRVILVGVGRLKAGLERDLSARYLDRAAAAGRALGLAVEAREVEEGRARRVEDRRREESDALRAVLPPDAVLVALDETGRAASSPDFAALVGKARDDGRGALAIVIGGPDGLDPDLRRRADHAVAFGAMTWPHQLVRVMAAEQIYRAVTIIAGHPYHRG